MKQLLICRHAKSSWKHPELADIDRPLAKRGKRNARQVGILLAAMDIRPNLIITSPARRARKTAQRLAKKIGYPRSAIRTSRELYGTSLSGIMHCIQRLPKEYKTVMLVGHNPVWTELVNALAGLGLANVPTCGIVAISFQVSSWEEIRPQKGRLDLFLRPGPLND